MHLQFSNTRSRDKKKLVICDMSDRTCHLCHKQFRYPANLKQHFIQKNSCKENEAIQNLCEKNKAIQSPCKIKID